ncbi:MAG: hypothetical protein WAN36_09865 [Calditrichia bacterium]
MANLLYNQQLYEQAVAEYQDYLQNYPLEENERANITYTIGNIYFDQLNDYENALAYYLRVRQLYPNSNLQKEVSRKVVESLERLHRSTDARQVIQQSAALDESQKPHFEPGTVVARLGEREITNSDIQREINRLPVYLREQISTREQKREFLQNYIAQELLYESARRKGMEKDPEVRAELEHARKALMAQELLRQEVEAQAGLENYSNADVELYYKANKEKYAEKDEQGNIKRIPPFSEVAEQAARDFAQEKQQQAYQQLIQRLMQAEQVRIYDDKIE